MAAVKRQLEEWKGRFPRTYRDAYMSVSAAAIFAPFVRLELLRWQPLHAGPTGAAGGDAWAWGQRLGMRSKHVGCAGVDQYFKLPCGCACSEACPHPVRPSIHAGFDWQSWYQELFDYGMPADAADADPSDPDADLLPRLVRKLVLPLASHALQHVWNPFSRRQSAAAAAVLEDLMVYVPPEDEGLQQSVRGVMARLEAAVAAVPLPPWPPAALAASRRARLFLARRFGKAVRLLAAAAAFRGVLPAAPLRRLLLEQLVAQQLVPHVRAAAAVPSLAAERAERLLGALPQEWLAGAAPKALEGLRELLLALARPMEAAAAAAGGGGEPEAAAARTARQLSGVLVKLGEVTRGNALAKAYWVL